MEKIINNFVSMVKDLGILVTDEQIDLLNIYVNFLLDYNSHTNITSVTDKEEVYVKHFYDSLTLVKAIDLDKISTLLDIGSGAGFPGMVIKVIYPNIDVTLVDSNNKKTKFLTELASKLGVEVKILNCRVEDCFDTLKNSFDLVTSRAVSYLDIIASLSLPFVNNKGKVVLMKGDFINEKKLLIDKQGELNISKYSIIDVSYLNNIRNLVVLERKVNQDKFMNYSQLVKRSKRWRN